MTAENSQGHAQVFERNISARFKKEVDSDVAAVKNWAHDATSTAMDTVVIPSVEVAVNSSLAHQDTVQAICSKSNMFHSRDFPGIWLILGS